MKKNNSESELTNQTTKPDWKEILVEIVLKILSLGLYHVKKHKGK